MGGFLTMAELGEKIVKEYLENLGFDVQKIPEEEYKTPDFVVYLWGIGLLL